MRSHLIKLLVALCAVGWTLMTSAAERVPLVLEARIPLGDVKGRIDHLAVDVAHRRLFVAVRAAGGDGAALWQFRPVDSP